MSRTAPSLQPPFFACWILECVLPSPSSSAMVGDLIEEYVSRATVDSFGAALWFWSQTLRSVPSVMSSAARSDWRMNIRIAALVYVMMVAAKLGLGTLFSAWITLPEAQVLSAPIFFVIINGAGGLVISRIRHAAAVLLVAMVMVTVVVLSVGRICPTPVPWWYQFGFFAVAPFAVLIPPAVLPWATSARP